MDRLEARAIRRLLVANRGEIAVRIMHACRELGIETVAVYSDVDDRSPHVLAADHAVALGPAPATDSYLSIDRVIDAARHSQADAVHPGYGFLSESASFAAACADSGLIFVGPPADVIARMGSKIEARRLVHAAGVPVVPGETPVDQSDAGVTDALQRVGFPALIKASAGGGGKGMRRIEQAGHHGEAIQAARREAIAAFGDGTLYVERLVDKPHHVEIQIFGGNDGAIVHLFERECSVQRRHQKIIEESPSPALTPGVRDRMTAAAIAAARAVGYRNAGTVEFLLDRGAGPGDNDARFYFLEMNTRLQVEHPVTEEVTGLDLVRAQILVAAGEGLPWSQEDICQRGHVLEARIYAEDPANNFLPQAGRLLLYREPRTPGVRIDSGVREGAEVSIHYDPIMAKVIARAESRDLAIGRLRAALTAFPILGVRTNIPFLLRILDDHRFSDGTVDTAFLDRGEIELAPTADDMPEHVRQVAALADVTAPRAAADQQGPTTWDPWG